MYQRYYHCMMSSRSCPKCGSRRLIIGEDKSKPVGYAFTSPIYAKQFTCKECTNVWNEGEEGSKPVQKDEAK